MQVRALPLQARVIIQVEGAAIFDWEPPCIVVLDSLCAARRGGKGEMLGGCPRGRSPRTSSFGARSTGSVVPVTPS